MARTQVDAVDRIIDLADSRDDLVARTALLKSFQRVMSCSSRSHPRQKSSANSESFSSPANRLRAPRNDAVPMVLVINFRWRDYPWSRSCTTFASATGEIMQPSGDALVDSGMPDRLREKTFYRSGVKTMPCGVGSAPILRSPTSGRPSGPHDKRRAISCRAPDTACRSPQSYSPTSLFQQRQHAQVLAPPRRPADSAG